ncbi:metallophosphoesterase [Echinicola sp. 20G]|uniref:metallophosphoesterase n=1 Tax=Echinicola sp. 20G TaxID=2781961 RepID=UPI0019104AB5|nr:metallophosphoesterase [Echinicola sp. 20G]
MNRRSFLISSGLLAGGLASGVYAWQVEPFWLEFVQRKMPIKHLPSGLEGKTLMQISDVHVGNNFDYQYIIEAFKEAKTYQPDIVVYTGDYVSYENEEQLSQMKEVFQYAVKGKLGTIGILGNHDYGHKWAQEEVAQQIIGILKEHDIPILRNEAKKLAGLNIIGIDDYWAINFKPEELHSEFAKEDASIVLCHNPDVCDLDVWNGYQGWILSGHTHGGQCKPPFLPPPILPVKNKRYNAGEIDLEDGRKLYINRALGHYFQVRFNVRPEITLFQLEAVS